MKRLFLVILFSLTALAYVELRPTAVLADATCADGRNVALQADCADPTKVADQLQNCKGVKVSFQVNCNTSSSSNPIYAYLTAIIKFAGGLVGLLVVGMIILSGIQYITSAGNPPAVSAAKNRLIQAIIGLVLFILMFGILNYLIPGGVLQ